MNKLSTILVVGVIACTFFACEKEPIDLKNEDQNTSIPITGSLNAIDPDFQGISVRNGVLCFNSVENYQSIVSSESENDKVAQLIEQLHKTDFNNYGKSHREDSEYKEPFMDAIMNKDKIVKIGEWFIYIDMPTASVLVISEKEEDAYHTLINQTGKNIQRFSIGDDVLDHLLDKSLFASKSCGGIGGGVYPCYSAVYNGQIVKTFSDNVVWRLNPFVRFFRAGIYFKLSSQYEIWRFPSASHTSGGQIVSNITNGDIEVQMFVKWQQGWWRKRPCNSSSVGTLSPGYHYSQSVYGNYSKTIYSGSRNLNGYYLYVQGRVKYPNGTYTIASPYGGRNINSPY